MVNLDNLFFRIHELNLTAKKVADETGISTGNISDWKSGRSMPSATKLYILADYLDCSVDYLLGRKENPSIKDELVNNDNFLMKLYDIINVPNKEKLIDYAKYLLLSEKDKSGESLYTITKQIARGDGRIKEEIITMEEADKQIKELKKLNVLDDLDI